MIRSLYVHIPFCIKKCLYCDFNSYTSSTLQTDYAKALEKELLFIEQNYFETIFIGGGTPTILSLENLERVLSLLSKFEAKEFTVECNPGTLDREKLELMKTYGVNRLSIGLQAWQDKHLIALGRIHNQEEFLQNYQLAREVGFDNINIDLMFGIPNQTMDDWQETIDHVLMLKPEHLSCYGLIVEEGTPFYQLYENGTYQPLEEDLERDMYEYAIQKLKQQSLSQYEISNFSLRGRQCMHNITYWNNEQYVGVGAGAHSFVDNVRYSNKYRVQEYIDGILSGNGEWVQERIKISLQEEISEYMFLGLRMLDGIHRDSFRVRFGVELKEIYEKEIDELKGLGLLSENDGVIQLTRLGLDLSNQVFIRFLR